MSSPRFFIGWAYRPWVRNADPKDRKNTVGLGECLTTTPAGANEGAGRAVTLPMALKEEQCVCIFSAMHH